MKSPFHVAGLLLLLVLTGCSSSSITHDSSTRKPAVIISKSGIVLHGVEKLSTPGRFQPPVQIEIVAKTDSTNLRLSYAADEVIFNWENDREQLRVDGGPANGLHQAGKGNLPENEYVTIRWIVTPLHQAIYVNDELRFEHAGDYSHLDRPVSITPAVGSVVTVKSLKVKQL
jgi:hypothetical protein